MRRNIVPTLLITYAGLLLFVTWWPFDFRLHSGSTSIEWPPFKLLFPEYWSDGKVQVLKIVTFVPLGGLLAINSRLKGDGMALLGRAILAGISLGLLIQIGWIFLPGRLVSASDCVLNVIGAVAGASAFFFLHLSRQKLGLLTALYSACFLIAATSPWHFSIDAATLAHLPQRIEWTPFENRLSMWTLKEGALNSLMTVPLGVLAATYALRGAASTRRALAVAGSLGLACSLLVESLQCFLPTRTPSVADLVLNSVGAISGGALAYFLERWNLSHPPKANQPHPRNQNGGSL